MSSHCMVPTRAQLLPVHTLKAGWHITPSYLGPTWKLVLRPSLSAGLTRSLRWSMRPRLQVLFLLILFSLASLRQFWYRSITCKQASNSRAALWYN